jgi:hypothetical protein
MLIRSMRIPLRFRFAPTTPWASAFAIDEGLQQLTGVPALFEARPDMLAVGAVIAPLHFSSVRRESRMGGDAPRNAVGKCSWPIEEFTPGNFRIIEMNRVGQGG